MEGGEHGRGGGDSANDQPTAAANPEVGDGGPEAVDGLGKDEERDDLRAAADADSLLAEQIGEDAADNAVGEDRVWRDEETEEPGAFFLG